MVSVAMSRQMKLNSARCREMSAIIPENTIEPIAWGYSQGDKTKAWFL